MATFNVLENGVVITSVIADEAFMEANYSEYELVPLTEDQINAIARRRRNGQLESTDWIVPVTDHPQHVSYLAYREALRDWPSTVNFPETKPTITQ